MRLLVFQCEGEGGGGEGEGGGARRGRRGRRRGGRQQLRRSDGNLPYPVVVFVLRCIGRKHTLDEEQKPAARRVAAGSTLRGRRCGTVGRVCVAGAPLLGKATTRGVQGARHARQRAARVDCDAMGIVELCAGADVVVLEARYAPARCAAAGEGGGRSGGAHAQFSQAATPVEIGLRDEREARGPVASGLCTIGPPSKFMAMGYTG